jgi:tetratricopeptide (TPR) repeat protein
LSADAPTAFFSYSREDSEFALRLAKDLKKAGAPIWMDKLDIRGGQLWERVVEEALTNSPRVLVILSPASVASQNVMAEAAFAIDEGKKVIPVLYRDCKIPLRLRPFQYVDFRDSYDDALQTLLDSMGTERLPEKTALQNAAPVAAEPKPIGTERIAREQQPTSTRSQETELALLAAAARARGDYSLEFGSSPQGSFVFTKFSPGFVKVAIAIGILVIALLTYLAIRPNLHAGDDKEGTSASTSSSPPPANASSNHLTTATKDAPDKKADGSLIAGVASAAEPTSPEGMNARGDDFYYGKGVPKDYALAVTWYRRAAEAGNNTAMDSLGWMYDHGEGVTQDYQQALSWYRKAAEAGNNHAMNNLGWMYENGKAVTQDYQQALSWYRKAAEAGNSSAMDNLGSLYENGKGVEKDQQRAIDWYRKAAKLGNQDAINDLKRLNLSQP